MIKTSCRRLFAEVSVLAVIVAILYLTGLHVPVIGNTQKLVLLTGLFNPAPHTETGNIPDANYQFLLRDRSGRTISANRFKGEAVFINFWATWCPPCVAEIPTIRSLHQALDGYNVHFVLINQDANTQAVEKYLQQNPLQLPVYRLVSRLPAVYRSEVIPATFVISPQGKIVYSREGLTNYRSEIFIGFMRRISQEQPVKPERVKESGIPLSDATLTGSLTNVR